jgi:hypothetical protein
VVAVNGHGYGGEGGVWWTTREIEAGVRLLEIIISKWVSTRVGRAASDHIATCQARGEGLALLGKSASGLLVE